MAAADLVKRLYAAADAQRSGRMRWVLSTAMLDELKGIENNRRRGQATEFYAPPPLPEYVDPDEVRLFGWPIRVDDAMTELRLEADL